MFYNNALCDIYIGKGAGKKLLGDINNAQSSVKIVSPYLSPYLISELIALKNRSIDVKLITTDKIEDFYGNRERNIYKLIIQNRQTFLDKELIRNKWIDLAQILLKINYGLIALATCLIYYFKDTKGLLSLIPILVIFSIYSMYKTKIKNLRIYAYHYTQLFPFKVYISPDRESPIHSKIYLIDNKIAYLGSLNFTTNGTQTNYETRIRTTDTKAVDEIKKEIDDLYESANLPSVDLQFWGKKLYSEPIN